MLAQVAGYGGLEKMDLLAPEVDPGAGEPEVGTVGAQLTPEDVGVEGHRLGTSDTLMATWWMASGSMACSLALTGPGCNGSGAVTTLSGAAGDQAVSCRGASRPGRGCRGC